jgi:hypothetical protein
MHIEIGHVLLSGDAGREETENRVRLKGRALIVTGAGSGLGREVPPPFAAGGGGRIHRPAAGTRWLPTRTRWRPWQWPNPVAGRHHGQRGHRIRHSAHAARGDHAGRLPQGDRHQPGRHVPGCRARGAGRETRREGRDRRDLPARTARRPASGLPGNPPAWEGPAPCFGRRRRTGAHGIRVNSICPSQGISSNFMAPRDALAAGVPYTDPNEAGWNPGACKRPSTSLGRHRCETRQRGRCSPRQAIRRTSQA